MRIPNVTGLSLRDAAKAYIAAGFKVFPLAKGSKNPAPGFQWDTGAWSSDQDVDAWSEQVYGLGLPLAMNGLVALDVDHPEHVTPELQTLLGEATVFQSTDQSEAGRGHYVYATPRVFSNSLSRMPVKGWGEIRGTGYVVVEPTPHSRPGGQYRWQGHTVSALPAGLESWLTPAGEAATPRAKAEEVEAFLAEYVGSDDLASLDALVDAFVADCEVMPRNEAANKHFGNIFRSARAGLFPAQDAWDALVIALGADYEPDRAQDLLTRLGVARAIAATDDEVARLRPDHGLVVIEPEQHESFWEQRQTLSTIRQAAKARLIGPYALLGAVLVDVLAAVDPDVELDTYGGDSASLNLFVALVGKSGAGKSRTAKAAGDVIKIDGREHWQSLRSGEGLVAAYVQKQQGQVVQVARSAVIEMDEVDRLTSLGNRQGATILSTLRTAWIGGSLGGRAASGTSDLSVQRGTYRCNLVVGVQPGRSRALLADADGGTPQRFVWLPANDPEAELGHSWPAPIAWEKVEPGVFGGGRWAPDRNLTLPDSVVAKWQQDALMRARGDGDELDAHRMLCTAKLAAGFALLEMHRDVTEDDWRLAEHLMRVSDITRSGLLQELRRQDEQAAKAAGRLDAEREMVRAEHADSQLRTRVQEKVLRLLSEGKQPARHHFSGTQRKVLEDVLADMADAGMIRGTDEGIQLPA